MSFTPHPGPQTDFLARGEFEVLYGGAAGGGKTDCGVAEATRYVGHPKYHGLLLRKTFPRLQEIEDRTHAMYLPLGGKWEATRHRWKFPSGAKISLGHMQHENDKYNYQGKEYQYIFVDELTQFQESEYLYLFSRLRSTVPELVPYMRAATNPGGIGHAWVKRRFRIGTVDPRTTIFDEYLDQATGELRRRSRVFIPGKLTDNPTLVQNDPNYVLSLMALPELERRRLMDGVWDAFEGQAFPELNTDIHQFDHEIPPDWEIFGAFDWGAAKPWIYQLWAVDYDAVLYHFGELYGAKVSETGEYLDEGTRETDDEIAAKILAFESEMKVRPKYRVADPAIWSRRPQKGKAMPGPSPEETMRNAGVYFLKADNERIAGRREMHNRLKLDENGAPSLYVHKRCKGWWQLTPTLVEDPMNPEDILQKDVPDHIYDATRYAIMSRPRRPKKAIPVDIGSFQHERKRYLAAQRLAGLTGASLSDAYRKAR